MSTKPRTLRRVIREFCADHGIVYDQSIVNLRFRDTAIAKLLSRKVLQVEQVPQQQFLVWTEAAIRIGMRQPVFEITFQDRPDQTLVMFLNTTSDDEEEEEPLTEVDLLFRHELDRSIDTDTDEVVGGRTLDQQEFDDWQRSDAKD